METDACRKRKSSSTKDDAMPAIAKKMSFETFKFTSPGEWVAVYYYDCKAGHLYYIGQVLEIIEENKAVVTFLEQCTMKNSRYRFPDSLDIDTVDRKFVFHSKLSMTTINERMWTLENRSELNKLFKQFIRMYC